MSIFTKEGKNGEKKLRPSVFIYLSLLLLLLIVMNLAPLNQWVASLMMILRPILWGLILAYLLNPFFRFYERKLLYKLHPMGLRRTISLILTYLTLLLILGLMLALILPQIYSSISGFVTNFDHYVVSTVNQFNRWVEQFNQFLEKFGLQQSVLQSLTAEQLKSALSSLFIDIDKTLAWISQFFQSTDGSSSIIAALGNFVSGFTDGLFAIFISIYLLSTKEMRYAQVMKMRRALFSNTVNDYFTRFCSIADRSFGGFIEGKLLDSLIIGILTYIVISIFRIPYSILIAFIVGVTNVVPYIGPMIGTIPTTIIILLTDPSKAIPFLIIIFLIQQLDGNVIGPKILGNNTGVSSLCVLIAITVMGSIWGFTGMLLAVPVFATVLALVTEDINNRLRAKGLPSTTENYYPSDSIVNPAQDMRKGTDSLVKNVEYKYLLLQKKEERGEILTKTEYRRKKFYEFLKKLHIIPEITDQLLMQFTAEEAQKSAEEEALLYLRKMQGADLLEK